MDVEYEGGNQEQLPWFAAYATGWNRSIIYQSDKYWGHKGLGYGTQDFGFTICKEKLQFIFQNKLPRRQTGNKNWNVKEEIWTGDKNLGITTL